MFFQELKAVLATSTLNVQLRHVLIIHWFLKILVSMRRVYVQSVFGDFASERVNIIDANII